MFENLKEGIITETFVSGKQSYLLLLYMIHFFKPLLLVA